MTPAMGHRILTSIIFGLFVIGVLFTLLKNPLSVLIPLVILGIIVYFLRKPRHRFQRGGPTGDKRRPASPFTESRKPGERPFALKLKTDVPDIPEKQKQKNKKKQHNFRVIEGKKGKTPPADNTDDKHLLH